MGVVRSFALACVLAGCVGGVSTGGGGSGSNHSNPDSNTGGAVDAPGGIHWIDAANGSGNGLPCQNMATPPGDGHHNPGMDCQQGCHNHGFTVCGTLWANSTGNTPFAGAHVTITDANNRVTDLVTMQNGNFYTTATVAFPITILTSSCPSAAKMNAAASSGRCNQSACHPGATAMQLHLP